MAFDLLIRNGTVIDGSGTPRYHADVGVRDGKVAFVGRAAESAKETIDAEGHIVAPGFVDGHTHMDAQVFWDPIGSCSCYHGVTSVVMGNCGFTLAPCRESEADLVFRNLERAEDIAREAMLAGIQLALGELSRSISTCSTALPQGHQLRGLHGPLGAAHLRHGRSGPSRRKATEDEIRQAHGRTLARRSRSRRRHGLHDLALPQPPDLRPSSPVASRQWPPGTRCAPSSTPSASTGAGMFEIAGEAVGRDPRERIREYHERLKALAVESGVPITWGLFANRRKAPEVWRSYSGACWTRSPRPAGSMFAQVHSRSLNVHLHLRVAPALRHLGGLARTSASSPLAEQKAKLKPTPNSRRPAWWRWQAARASGTSATRG